MLRKVLIANRGEIAVRIARTLREMGIGVVAVHSEVDEDALHVRVADEAYEIGPAAAAESYLRIDKLMDVAKRAGCDGLHPGYGFLSENPALPEACAENGITFIGPPASAMRSMGLKTAAREKMAAAGVPVVPGGDASHPDEAIQTASRIGYPVMLKATAGGGGKGMRLVHKESELLPALERARSEAKKAFGDETVYIEKAILKPRHVEIQILADQHGNAVHLFERDCSIQRRHQKVVEETPCPAIDAATVAKMGELAVKGARAVGYYSAGTFEFLLGDDQSFYFLEMNTRLQVEHPITELITGFDLVREMVRIAQGEPLGFDQSQIRRQGAAIECRIYAEDPSTGFLPSPGRIHTLRTPGGPGVRDDSGTYAGATISANYDPLVSKLCVWAPDRARAVERMRRALGEYVVGGIATNLPFHDRLFRHPEFVAGRYDTGFIDRNKEALLDSRGELSEPEAMATALAVLTYHGAQHVRATDSGRGGGLSPWVSSHRARLGRRP
ncbi:MAG: acetyl-CoA carboxylase biotin carboxylase subunit [Polyangiaceae bacterium]